MGVNRQSEDFITEDLVLKTARGLAEEAGLTPVSPGTGAVLRLLASAIAARTAVEIGTGTGVSSIWLMHGMRADGVLTTIDVSAEHQRMARRLFVEAGYPGSRTRIITGRAVEVLPRLSDGIYDLVFLDADPVDYESYVDEAARLLRAGGMLIAHGVLARMAAAKVAAAIRDSEQWSPALIPLGDGILAAIRQ